MSTFMSWLFHPVERKGGSGGPISTFGPPREEDAGPERLRASLIAEGGTGLTQASGMALFVGFEVLAHRQSTLLDGLTPVREKAALISFVGMGITDPNRYEDAAAMFISLRLMTPAHEGALIQVFVQQLREESLGSDFLYVHFAGDPLSLGFLICALCGGGLMAGWTRLLAPNASSR